MSPRRPVFSLCTIFRGSRLRDRANSLFPQKPQVCGQWGALCQKRGFGTRIEFYKHCKYGAKAWFCLREEVRLRDRANSLFRQKPQVCGQWGALCQKCDFGTREKSARRFCFELSKQNLPMKRALPSAARFEGHTFQSARPFGARLFYMPQSCPPRRPRPAGLRRAGARACLCKRACLCERMCAYLIARGSVRARLPVPPPLPEESCPPPPRAGGAPPRERGRREDCAPRVSSSFLPARDTPSSAPCTRARPCIWGRAAGWACRTTTPRPGAHCAARRSRTGGG